MPIQVDQPKPKTGKLLAGGVLVAVLLLASAMPRIIRTLFIMAVILAAVAAGWLFL